VKFVQLSIIIYKYFC